MKTRTTLFLILFLATASVSSFSLAPSGSTKVVSKSNAKATTAKTFLTCMGRYASYFRSFMPYDEDPCNHTPSRKSVC